MVKTAVNDANAGFNVYVEPRTLRADLRGSSRGTLDDTVFVFAVVVDADNDKGKGGRILARPTITVETSPGNFHYWYLFDRPVSARTGQTDRRHSAHYDWRGRRHGRCHPALPRRRHAKFPVEGETDPRAHLCGAHAPSRADRSLMGS